VPIKQVVCAVCGQTVNKAQTYFTGKGRACKSHEGIKEKRDELQKAALAKTERAREALVRKFQRPEPLPMDMKPHCWICLTPGLRQQEFFLRVLVAMQKIELTNGGPVNPFTLKEPLVSEMCIFVVAKEKCPPAALSKIHRDLRGMVDMFGFAALCGRCGTEHGIELLPKVEWEQLASAGAAYEVFVKPVIKKIAVQEVTRDN